jgi:predicted AAA+ superfamily ATPase
VGPRQAGKSSAIWTHLAAVGEQALHIDCELRLVRDWCRTAPLFLADIEALLGRPVTLFFDEVQHLEDAGLFLKGLVDRRYPRPILVTGSSSYHLGARTRESLAGRASRSRLLPFSLDEVCQDLVDQPPALRARLRRERMERHWVYGGYPGVWLSDLPTEGLTDLAEALVLRDASDLFRIGRPDAFRRLLALGAGQAGQRVNLSEWASILGVSRDTVGSYLEILESSHIVVALPPFAGGKRAEITSSPKLYWVDCGLRNHLVRDFRPLAARTDAGALLENWVFTELWKALPESATLHFWRSTSGAEVDFVITQGETLVAIEVKAGDLGRATIPRPLRSFVEAYRPVAALIVNRGLEHHDSLGSTSIQWLAADQLVQAVTTILVGENP